MSLTVSNANRSFGGVVAVSDVSISVSPGTIHGLIGPNGCGKTTLLNLICGYYTLDSGGIQVDGVDLNAAEASDRASLGLARTFQVPRVLTSLTVVDNVMLGAWSRDSASFFDCMVSRRNARREEQKSRSKAMDFLAGVGLGAVAEQPAGSLKHSDQRFLEIARALMSAPKILLLDEPAGGLSQLDIERLGSILEIIRDQNVGILLVEHHADFVFGLSNEVTALNSGKLMVSGLPEKVRSDPELQRVYLGG